MITDAELEAKMAKVKELGEKLIHFVCEEAHKMGMTPKDIALTMITTAATASAILHKGAQSAEAKAEAYTRSTKLFDQYLIKGLNDMGGEQIVVKQQYHNEIIEPTAPPPSEHGPN